MAIYPQASTTATGTSGQFTITVASTTSILVGMYVTGTGIATGAVVIGAYLALECFAWYERLRLQRDREREEEEGPNDRTP